MTLPSVKPSARLYGLGRVLAAAVTCGLPAGPATPRPTASEWRIVVVGDVHGAYPEFVAGPGQDGGGPPP